MIAKTLVLPVAALVALAVATPAIAQNRWMDQAREAAARRAENKAVREAEHPDTVTQPATAQQAATASTATPAPAETTPAAQSPTPAAQH